MCMHVGGSIPGSGSASCLGIACMRSLVACLARIPGAQLQVVHFGANCFFRGDARVGGTEAPLVEPHIAGSSACGGSLWAGGRNGCGDLRDRVSHTGQCEAEWGGWGALGSGRGDAPHQSPCLPSCEGLHGTWCLKLFLNFCLKVEQSIFAFFHEMVDGGRAHEFVASSWQLEGGYHSYERPLCPRAAACEVHDAY